MKKRKRKIVVVSLFSGMDLFLFACVKAGLIPGYACERNIYAALMHAVNFHHADGSPLIEFVNITQEEYFLRKGQKDLVDTCTEKDGQFIRAKTVEEVNGFDIRRRIEKEYGSDVIIILIGGPPCQDLISFNPSRNSGVDGDPTSRNFLMFEYLRLLKELDPDVALMEQSTQIGSEKNSHILNRFISEIRQLPFRVGYLDMDSIHFLGNQSRLRRVFLFVSDRLNKMPVFPIPMPEKAKRVRDFLDIDRFHSGHFTDRIKTKNDFMGTVTSGSPLWFYQDERKWHPTIDELLWCDDVKPGEYIIPSDIPAQQVKKALGNVVVVSTGYALITTVLEKILCLKPDGDGYWVPIDGSPDEPLPPDDGGSVPAPPDGGDITSPGGSGGNALQGGVVDSATPVLNEQGEPKVIVVEAEPVSIIPLPKDGQERQVNSELSVAEHHAPSVAVEPQVTINSQPADVPTSVAMPPIRNIIITNTSSKKIITSTELKNMQFQSLNFEGKWLEFFGLPSLNFGCVIFGSPGNGKSTFAIQFADYLALNFGKTLYISGEEGFTKTFKDKFVISNAGSDLLDVADVRNYDELRREVSINTYNFILIDSLDTMKINAGKMKQLRSVYKNSAIIVIAQSTKAGDMRGSNEIIHDSDIVVNVGGGGIATTVKNRFKEKGTTFDIFQKVKEVELTNGSATS